MSFTVLFHEVAPSGGGFVPAGTPEHLGTFASEAQARSFISSNVNTYDREWMDEAEIAGQREPMALFQAGTLLGFYRITA